MKIPIIVIVGATASGKTELSLELAKKFNGEIISVDSVQVYKYFDIGSAKIKNDEMRGINHYLLSILEPSQKFSVYEFQKEARKKIMYISKKGKIPVLIGGTGYYMNAVIYDYNFANYTDDNDLLDIYFMKKYLFEKYNSTYNNLDLMNKRRIINAYNYVKSEEKDTINNNNGNNIMDIYSPYVIVVDKERDVLYNDINNRVNLMIKDGLISEVESIIKKYGSDLPALGAIGYKEVVSYLNNEISFDSMVDLIKQNSRRYAKRQLTWFRNKIDARIWYNPKKDNYESLVEKIEIFLNENNYENN